MPMDAPFDADFLTLAGLIPLTPGSLCIFFGAGLSFHSGIPLANTLRNYLAGILTSDPDDVRLIAESSLPFEAFMETIFRNFVSTAAPEVPRLDQNQDSDEIIHQAARALEAYFAAMSGDLNASQLGLLNLFRDDRLHPTSGHRLIAHLAQAGIVRTVVTTNFDLLLETACDQLGMERDRTYRVLFEDGALLTASQSPFDGLTIYKVHGSAENISSIRTTLDGVANKRFVPQREAVIAHAFQTGTHKAVLVMGYSCSDLFDICPAIQRIDHDHKFVVFVDHADQAPALSPLSTVPDTERKAIFRRFPGWLITGNTDALIASLWQSQVGAQQDSLASPSRLDWRLSIDAWKQDITNDEHGFDRSFIVSLILSHIAQYARAIAYAENCIRIVSVTGQHTAMLPGLYGNIAGWSHELGDLHRYREYSKRVGELLNEQTSTRTQIEALLRSAPDHLIHERREDAIRIYEEGLALNARINDDEIAVVCYCGLANAYVEIDYDKAEAAANKALEIAQNSASVSMLKAQCRVEVMLCRAAAKQKDLDKLRQHGEAAQRLAPLIGDDTEILISFVGLADALHEMEMNSQAEAFFLQALPLAEKTHNLLLEYVCCFYLGQLINDYCERRGTYNLMIAKRGSRYFARAVEITHEIDMEEVRGECLAHWGIFSITMCDRDQAISCFTEAAVIFKKHKRMKDYRNVRDNLASLKSEKTSAGFGAADKRSETHKKQWWEFWR